MEQQTTLQHPRQIPWMMIALVITLMFAVAAIAFAAWALQGSGSTAPAPVNVVPEQGNSTGAQSAPMQVVIVTPVPPARTVQAPAVAAKKQTPKATVNREIPAALSPEARGILSSKQASDPAQYLFESLPLMMRGETNLLITTLVPSKEARNEFVTPFLEAKAKGEFDETLPYRSQILIAGEDVAVGRVVQGNNKVFQVIYIHTDDQKLWVVELLAVAPGPEAGHLGSIENVFEIYKRSWANAP